MEINTFKPYEKNLDFVKKTGLPKVLSLQVDRGGCGFYRVRALFRKLAITGKASCAIIEHGLSEDNMRQSFIIADTIIARGGTLPMQNAVREQFGNKRIVFDHDDNTFITLPSNENYRDTGTEDIWVDMADGKKEALWVTGLTPGFNKYRNERRLSEMKEQMHDADLVTAPTERLANVWAEQNPHTAVVHNLIDFDLYPDEIITPHPEIRIGWQGGVSHPGDFFDIGKTFAEMVKGNIYFYSIGAFFKEVFGECDNVRMFPWTESMAHSYRMKLFNLDIAVIPLQDVPFNYFKSEVKFSEFAALRVPCLVKRQSPYVEVVKEEETALMYDSPKEFKSQLERLIKDVKLRKRLADNAYSWVKKNRNMDLEIDNVLATWLGKV